VRRGFPESPGIRALASSRSLFTNLTFGVFAPDVSVTLDMLVPELSSCTRPRKSRRIDIPGNANLNRVAIEMKRLGTESFQ
jgi:hypothetical protein